MVSSTFLVENPCAFGFEEKVPGALIRCAQGPIGDLQRGVLPLRVETLHD